MPLDLEVAALVDAFGPWALSRGLTADDPVAVCLCCAWLIEGRPGALNYITGVER